jgi:cytochrome c-type biogenesis protein CcmH/NrfG
MTTQRNFDRALELCRQAIKLDPKRASAHMLAGEALLAKSDAADGIKELETARDIDPDEVRAHWDLLRAYVAAGRTDDANREKQTIEKLNDAHVRSRSSDVVDNRNDPSAP